MPLKKKILVITNNDAVWLKPAWSKLFVAGSKHFEINFITLPEKKIKNKNPLLYYFVNFGFLNFILLSIFSVARILKYYKSSKNTFKSEVSTNLKSFNTEIIENKISQFKPDFIFITCSYIIPKQLIDFNSNIMWFNKHASLLPDARGVYPYIYNKINEKKQGLTFHYVNENIDDGDIVYSEEINESISMVDFYKQIYNNFDNYFLKFYDNYLKNVRKSQMNPGSYYSYPNRKTIKNFFDKEGKIILLRDFLNA